MFVDACAIIAVLSGEREADRVSRILAASRGAFTSPVAVLEAALSLARPDKFSLPVAAVEEILMEFLKARSIEIKDLPPARETTHLVLSAAHRYRGSPNRLNLGDCLHYACAKYYGVPVLATDGEFRQTDLETIA